MNAFDLVAIPPAVVTATFLTPAVPVGVFAVMVVVFTTTTLVAGFGPTFTVAPVAKFVPMMVIAVPPTVEPVLGLTLVIVGDEVV